MFCDIATTKRKSFEFSGNKSGDITGPFPLVAERDSGGIETEDVVLACFVSTACARGGECFEGVGFAFFKY